MDKNYIYGLVLDQGYEYDQKEVNNFNLVISQKAKNIMESLYRRSTTSDDLYNNCINYDYSKDVGELEEKAVKWRPVAVYSIIMSDCNLDEWIVEELKRGLNKQYEKYLNKF